jgi:hypothetical protein
MMTSGPDDFFSVEAVYLAWFLQSAAGADYMKQARENGLAVGFVSVTERKNVVEWLEGKNADNERIVPLVGTNMYFLSLLFNLQFSQLKVQHHPEPHHPLQKLCLQHLIGRRQQRSCRLPKDAMLPTLVTWKSLKKSSRMRWSFGTATRFYVG